MKGYLYILISKSNERFYIGSSINYLKRLGQHNNGDVVATRNKGPWKIVFIKEFVHIADARKIEYKLKKLKSRKIIEKIVLSQVLTIK